jgi:hypothetical protein
MTRPSVRGRRAGQRSSILAGAVLTLLLATSCTPAGEGDGAAPPPSSTATAAAEPTVAPLREAREGWKVFTDPGRLISFELPQEWVVQPLETEPGVYAPDSLHYAVRTPDGVTTAQLHSGILTPEPPCSEGERTPYSVIGSEPLTLTDQPPAADGIEPRFVVRLITGFRFFGAYGITDQVGGPDGLACSLSNTVQGGEALGRFSFGDLEVLAPKAPANTGPQTVSFGTIGEADEYYATPEFMTIREMISSVRIAPAPAG